MVAPVHLVAPFRAGGALAGVVRLVDDGFVEDVTAEWEVEVGVGVVGEVERFHCGEGVDCCGDLVVGASDGVGGGRLRW